MAQFYHFKSLRPAEHLVLSENHKLSGNVAQYLSNFQIDGLRFLYKNYERNEACILNDESGLGKTALVASFLQAILPVDLSRKCLIIVKDEEKLKSWRFHLNLLTKFQVKTMNSEKDLGMECIYIILWETLRRSIPLTNISFDCIILDDRGELTSNRICLNYFLRNYENKISLIIASTDVTLDLIQLHGILRLCDHLGEKFQSLVKFQDHFCLPRETGPKEGKNLLEAYFQRREKIINYCREFRLRRYRHQFEEELPFVTGEEYRKYYNNWFENEFSPSSSSEQSTEELFRRYCNLSTEENNLSRITEYNCSQISQRENNNDEVIMSPLLFETDSEDYLPAKQIDENANKLKQCETKNNKSDRKIRNKRKKYHDLDGTNRTTRSHFRITRSKSQKYKYLVPNVSDSIKRLEEFNKRKPKRHQKVQHKHSDEIKENKNIASQPFLETQLRNVSTEGYLNKFPTGLHMNSKYDFSLDFINKNLFIEPNNSEMPICSPKDVQMITLTSSNEDSNIKTSKKNSQLTQSNKIITSPELFSSCEEYDINCTQKFKSYSNTNIENKKLIENRYKPSLSCLDILGNHFFSSETEIPNSESHEIFSTEINNTFLLKNRDVNRNKITKYLVGNELTPRATNTKSSHSSPRTPTKQKISQRSLGSKSPKASTSAIGTPNRLTNWLIKSGSHSCSIKTTKRKRLDIWFKD